MKKGFFLIIFFSCIESRAQLTPDKVYGELFKEVQLQKVFPDGKSFVDCVPKRAVRDIMYDYGLSKPTGEALKKFIEDNFVAPISHNNDADVSKTTDLTEHINKLWEVLLRKPDETVHGSSLLSLPLPYIVPGGRFREIYYWDSYFTMLGLKESGRTDVIENMIDNFAYLINTYGHIPNGNRSYYLSRSQPPFFSMMVELLAGIKGKTVYNKYLSVLQKEWAYWNDKTSAGTKHVVTMPDGSKLNRYWDADSIPRQESYKEDYETAEQIASSKMMTIRFASEAAMNKFRREAEQTANRHLRSGAESGWDFSSRWFADEKTITTIQTTDIIPVDLNCLLYHLESTIAKIHGSEGKNGVKNSNTWKILAAKRKAAIEKFLWNNSKGFYFDFNLNTKSQQTIVTAAGIFPLSIVDFDKNVMVIKGNATAKTLEKYLLKDGGIVCTPNTTGQQWDAPNGWAPLQWMAITALERSNQKKMAALIARRWIKLNADVFKRTGKMMEKYNVVDTHLEAGGGEYPGQDGFGWTNGVLLALIKKYGLPKQ